MRFEYDPDVDILVIELADVAARHHHSERLSNGAVIDLAEDGTILAIEIMGASKRYPSKVLNSQLATYDEPISIAEAAKVAGCSTEAIKKAISRGRLRGQKIGRNWTTTTSDLSDYLNSRLHAGPSTVVAERSQDATIVASKAKLSM